MPDLPAFITDHDAALIWIAGASLVMFVATLIAGPWAVLRIPADYFAHERRPASRLAKQHPAIRIGLIGLRTVLGVVFILAGLAMLVLPGQGLLTILIGVLLLQFPGKYRFERWLMRRRWILGPANALRGKRRKEPLVHPDARRSIPAPTP